MNNHGYSPIPRTALPSNINIHPGQRSPRSATMATSFFSSSVSSSPCSFISAFSTVEADRGHAVDEHELVSCSFTASQLAFPAQQGSEIEPPAISAKSESCSRSWGQEQGMDRELQPPQTQHQSQQSNDHDNDEYRHGRRYYQPRHDHPQQSHVIKCDSDHDPSWQEQLPVQTQEVTPIIHSTTPTTCVNCLPVPSLPMGSLAHDASSSLPSVCMCQLISSTSSCAAPLPHRRYRTISSTVASLGLAAAQSKDKQAGDNEMVCGNCDAIVPSLAWSPSMHLDCHINSNPVLQCYLPIAGMTPPSEMTSTQQQHNAAVEIKTPTSSSPTLPLDTSRLPPGSRSLQQSQLALHLAQQQYQQKGDMAEYSSSSSLIPSTPQSRAQRSSLLSNIRRSHMATASPSSLEYAAASPASSSAFHSPSTSITWASPLRKDSRNMTMTHHFISLSESADQSRSNKGNGKGKDKDKTIVRGQQYSKRRSGKTCFDGMPREIKIHIFRYLSTFQLIRMSRVSRSWRGIAMDGSLWKVVDTTRFYKTIKDDQLRTLGTAASGFLRYANFRGCVQLSARSLSAIAEHCPNIERLNLMGCRSITSDAIANACMNMPLLLHVDLGGLQSVNNYTLQTMAVNCRSIQTLNLAWCKQISGSGLSKLTRSCQELRKLNISGCSNLEDRWMPMIGMNLPKLRELCLNGCSSLTDRGLIGLLSGLSVASSKKHQKWRMKKRMGSSVRVSSLGHLLINQSSCNDDDHDDKDGVEEDDVENDEEESDRETDIDDEDADGNNAGSSGASAPTPPTAPEGLQTRLVYLGLSQCHLLTHEALRAISHHCSRQLRRLELSSCENFGDESLVHLAQHCTRLSLLDLEDVTSLTDVSLRAFAMYLPKLERICLSYCENVTDQGVMRMLRPASNPTTLSTATAMLMNTEAASQYCPKLAHLELDNCLLITDRLLLEFANVLEERKAAALERQKERERKRQERRERMRQKKKRETATTQEPQSEDKNEREHSPRRSIDQIDGEQEKDTQNTGSGSSVAINIPNRFRHIPALSSGSVSSYSSSPLQPRSVLASTLLSEEVVVKKTRPGTRIMVPTRSSSSSSSSSSSAIPFWPSEIPLRRNSNNHTLNGKKGATSTTPNGLRAARRPIRPTIQVFDCRNVTLDGVEAAQTRSPSLGIRSYYSWSHPSTSAPTTSAAFGGSGATEGMDGGGDADDDDDDDGVDSINNNSSQTTLHHLQLQQQHLQQQLQRRSRAAILLQRARLGLAGGGDRDGCTIL